MEQSCSARSRSVGGRGFPCFGAARGGFEETLLLELGPGLGREAGDDRLVKFDRALAARQAGKFLRLVPATQDLLGEGDALPV